MAVAREDLFEDARATRMSVETTAGATSLSVVTGGLATWGPVVHGKFPVVVARATQFEEHLYGTAISGDQITGLTQVDGTPGMTYAHGGATTVEHGVLAAHIDASNEFLSMPQAKGDLAVATGADTWDRLAAGANDTLLVSDSAQAKGVKWTATPALSPSSLILPTSTTPAQVTDAQMVWDSDSDLLTVGTGAGRKTMVDTTSTQTLTGKTFDPGNVWTGGVVNLNTGELHLPVVGAPQTAEGVVVWDSDLLTIGDGTGRKTMVDTTSAQTLTGPKTLTAPVIGDFTAAQHDHGDADDGGALVVGALPSSTPRGTASVDDTFSSQSSTGSESAAMLSTTFTAASGRRYRAEVVGVRLSTDTANDVGEVRIKNAGATVQATPRKLGGVGGAGAEDATCIGYVIGAGASVTLEAVVVRTSGSGTVTGEAGNGVPSLLVTDVGLL